MGWILERMREIKNVYKVYDEMFKKKVKYFVLVRIKCDLSKGMTGKIYKFNRKGYKSVYIG